MLIARHLVGMNEGVKRGNTHICGGVNIISIMVADVGVILRRFKSGVQDESE